MSNTAMPAISFPLMGFSLGVLFSWSAAGWLTTGEPATRRDAFVHVLLFSFFIQAPSAVSLLVFGADWCFAYTLSSPNLTPALVPLLGGLNLASAPLGFLASVRTAERGQWLTLLAIGGLPLLAIALNTTAFWSRLGVEASYVEFNNDFGIQDLAGSALGYELLWIAVVLTVSVVWTHRRVRRLASAPSTVI